PAPGARPLPPRPPAGGLPPAGSRPPADPLLPLARTCRGPEGVKSRSPLSFLLRLRRGLPLPARADGSLALDLLPGNQVRDLGDHAADGGGILQDSLLVELLEAKPQ